MTTFRRYVDDPSTSETELHRRSGQHVNVIGPVPPESYDFSEVGPMSFVRFADGFEAEAFDEELTHE